MCVLPLYFHIFSTRLFTSRCHSHLCPLLSTIVLPPPSFSLFIPGLSIFPLVVSISKSSPVPGDGLLTLGIGSQRRHGGHVDAALEALWLASRAVPSPVPVVRCPKGNSHQRQWAAYQGKQHPPPCQPAHKDTDREKGRTSANKVQDCLVAEKLCRNIKAKSDASLSVL